MTWRNLVVNAVDRAVQAVLSAPMMPLTRYVPVGHYWLYDVLRFAGTRDLGIVFDVGANIGQTAHDLVRYLPKARIFCIEPVGSTMQQLKANYGRYSNIQFCQFAFGSKWETIRMPLHHDSELNTLVKDHPRVADRTGQSEIITVETIDNFCRSEEVNCIDLLKLDVQGWELEVLRGSEAMLTRNAIHFIFVEVGFHASDTHIQQFSELHNFMEGKGFNFCGLYDSFRYGAGRTFVGFSNALYINSAFA